MKSLIVIVNTSILIFLFTGHLAWAKVIYVNHSATGENNGSSWANAFVDLQDAVISAEPDDEIWVAAGRYIPGTTRESTFQLRENVALYGGFKDSETNREDRDWKINITVLSGDINGDDGPDFSNYDENVYHVVTGAEESTLDGFAIISGNANGNRFSENGRGGGVIGASMNFNNCTIEKNNATSNGGGILTSASTIINCTFRGNRSGDSGGGMYTIASTIINCTFSANKARWGGGVSAEGTNIINSVFNGNIAEFDGGGVANSNLLVANCTFVANSAGEFGGGLYNPNRIDPPKIINCIFWANVDLTGDGATAQIMNLFDIENNVFSSIIMGWPTQGVDGNLNGAPLFLEGEGPDGVFGTDDDDFQLLPGSPAVNSGDTNALPLDTVDLDNDGDLLEPLPLDLGLQSRVIGNNVDMGACEAKNNNINLSAEALSPGKSDDDFKDYFFIKLDNTGVNVIIEAFSADNQEEPAVLYDAPMTEVTTITINGSKDNDSLTIDHGYGLIVTPIFFVGGSGANELIAIGSDENDSLTVGNDYIGIGRAAVTFEEIDSLDISAEEGDDSLTIESMTNDLGRVELNGGTGTDTLIGADTLTTWFIDGVNQGDINGWGFSDIENLEGGSQEDVFVFSTGSRLDGYIDGGDGIDTLDYTNFNTPDINVVQYDITDSRGTNFRGFELNSLGMEFSGIDLFGGVKPTVSIFDHIFSEKAPARFEILLSLPSTNEITVNYETADGTAIGGIDFVTGAGTLVFSPGHITIFLNIKVNWDSEVEEDETFQVVIKETTNAVTTNAIGTGIIMDSAPPIFVDSKATGNDDGSSWSHAYTDLQKAITAAVAEDEIWVAAGLYVPGRTQQSTFQLKDDVTFYGGFKGTESLRDNRNWRLNRTILSGDIKNDDGPHFTNITDNVEHVVTGAHSVLDGFVVTGGNARGEDGGGMRGTEDVSMKIVNCIFEKNIAANGGGLAATDGTVLINCIFRGNSAILGGGVANSPARISNCIFSGNIALDRGGGIFTAFTRAYNCTFVGNSAQVGGGIYNDTLDVLPKMNNCIFWANFDDNGDGASSQLNSSVVTSSIIQGWPTPGVEGNLAADPLFVNAKGPDGIYGTDDDNFRLLSGSPAINSGDMDVLPNDTVDLDQDGDTQEPQPFDIARRSRVIGERVDMGANESPEKAIVFSAEDIAPGAAGDGVEDQFLLKLDPLGFNVIIEATTILEGLPKSVVLNTIPMVDISTITINGSGDNDSLAVDSVNGIIDISIVFNGLGGTNDLSFAGTNGNEVVAINNNADKIGGNTISIADVQLLAIAMNSGDDTIIFENIDTFPEQVTLDGGAGSDTLVGANLATTWLIEGVDLGKINGGVFARIEDLRGGNENDLFIFNAASQLSGGIEGGNGTDTLDYTSFGIPEVTILEESPETGYSGVESNSLGDGFSGIDLVAGAQPTLTINNQTITEGEMVQFLVSLSLPSTETVMVDYRTENGEAIAGEDYREVSGTLIFAPGETRKSVWVETLLNSEEEPVETFGIVISNPRNVPLSASTGKGTIQNLIVNIQAPDDIVTEGKTAQFNVSLSMVLSQEIIIGFQTENGEAVAGEDYQGATGTLVFAPGETQKSVEVETSKDQVKEANETYRVRLFDPRNPATSVTIGVGVIHDTVGPIFVDISATGNNDGSSWENAYIDLQEALAIAEPGDAIWVARGTYLPGQSRESTFQLPNGTSLYGGFCGVETSRMQSNPEINVTILSGDIAGDDNTIISSDEPTRAENSYHVITVNNTDEVTVLAGFVVIGGNANGLENFNKGGGIINQFGNLTVINCKIERNSSISNGGGMFNSSSKPTVIDCEFSDNTTDDGGGGGMANADSDPTVINCVFGGNFGKDGGAILNYLKSHPTLDDCIFIGNSVDDNGGAILNSQSNPLITRCLFVRNRTVKDDGGNLGGGGMLNASGSEPILVDCLFLENSTRNYGGGMYNPSSSPSVIRCSFIGNSAENGGGIGNHSGIAKLTSTSNPRLINCIFNENIARDNGGAMYNFDSHPTLVNCTFQKNSAVTNGGGIHNDAYGMIFTPRFIGPSAGSRSTVSNCIFWENTAGDSEPEIFNSSHSSSRVTHSCVLGGYPGTANIDENPLLTRDGHLRSGSPCIDSGTGLEAAESDLDGESRPFGDAIDIGADEFIDGDNDSLPDWLELQLTANRESLQANLDFDHDGLPNLEEYERSLNQVNPDTDFDGRWDGEEVVVDNGIRVSVPVTDPRNPDSVFAPYKRVIESEFLTGENESLNPVFHSTLVDTDDDDDLDILVTHIDGRVEIYENIGSVVSPEWQTPVMVELNTKVPTGSRVYMTDIVNIDGEMAKDGLKDIVIVDAKGQLILARNNGNTDGLPWGLPESGRDSLTEFIPTFDSPGDIDLDGDLDRFVGLDEDGKPVFDINRDEHLVIRPRYLTIVQGENQPLVIEGGHGEVTFSLALNTSGGSISPEGLYIAGLDSLGVDIIQAVAEDGLSGVVVVNVISKAEADRNAKVIIVVGTRSLKDSLFSTSERLARNAYVVCRQQGYSSGNIRLLTPDGKLFSGKDRQPLTTHLGYTVTTYGENTLLEKVMKGPWAGTADDLLLYFVDHGIVDNGAGQLLLNPNFRVSSTELNQWLNLWQTVDRSATVIIDTCYSGRFISELQDPPNPDRIIIGSSQPGQLAHFQAKGVISFSQIFWDELSAGATLGSAFLQSREGLVALKQLPTSDFNGDGVIDNDTIIETHGAVEFGNPALLSGIERPLVKEVMDDITAVNGAATLWVKVDDIVSNNGVNQVLAYIVPPTLQTDVDNGSAIVDMPNIELEDHDARIRIARSDFEDWQKLPEQDTESGRLTLSAEDKKLLSSSYQLVNDYYEMISNIEVADKKKLRIIQERLDYPPRYEGDWKEFDIAGDYRIVIFAQDRWGMLSPPKVAKVKVDGPLSKAIIVECSGSGAGNPRDQKQIHELGKIANRSLGLRSFTDDTIRWFGKEQLPPNKLELETSIIEWGRDAFHLVLYLVGNASPQGLHLTDQEIISLDNLKDWLDELQVNSDVEVTVIIDADYGSIFVPSLTNGSRNRHVLLSTGNRNIDVAHMGADFSRWFWNSVVQESVHQAFANTLAYSRAAKITPSFFLDDNGDGIFDAKSSPVGDGSFSRDRFIGTTLPTGDGEVGIGQVNETLTITASGLITLWASDILVPDGSIPNVWAEIIPPDFAAGGDLDRVTLSDNPLLDRWEGEHTFTDDHIPGRYIALIHAESSISPEENALPIPVEIYYKIPSPAGTSRPDTTIPRLIPDDEDIIASLGGMDGDMYRLWAVKGERFTITVSSQENSESLDLSLKIRAKETSVDTLIEVDDWGDGFSEQIWNWEPPDTGWYYVNVNRFPQSPAGAASYTLRVKREQRSGEDGFEVDDAPNLARYFVRGTKTIAEEDGEFQERNFHRAEDEDWILVPFLKDFSYAIKAVDLEPNCSPILEWYDPDDLESPINSIAAQPGETEVNLDTGVIQHTRTFYVRIRNGVSAFGVGTGYTLKIFATVGPDVPIPVFGELRIAGDPENRRITTRATIEISNDEILPVTRGEYYTELLPQIEPYILTAKEDQGGYLPQTKSILVSSNEEEIPEDFELAPVSSDGQTFEIKISAEDGRVDNLSNPYLFGTNALLVAKPDTHYEFSSWSGDVISEKNQLTNPLSFMVKSDVELIAHFEPRKYKLEVRNASGCDDCGKPLPSGIYTFGDRASWKVKSPWRENDGSRHTQFVADISEDNNILMDRDRIIDLDWVPQHFLSIDKQGHGLVNRRSGWRNAGQSLQIKAEDTNIYQFNRWITDTDSLKDAESPTVTVTMDIPKKVTAVFQLNPNVETKTHSFTFEKGWNLVSLPHFPDYQQLQERIFQRTIGNVWEWNTEMFASDRNLKNKTGYWLYCPEACTVEIDGVEDDNASIIIEKGWNLVGITEKGTLPSLDLIDDIIWYWNATSQRYMVGNKNDVLHPGEGYWIHSHEDNLIDLKD